MKVFVVHYKKLTERKQNLLDQFNTLGITDYEFIEQYDRDALMETDLGIFESGYCRSQIAITLSHIYAYKQISESKNYDCAMILEDDVILHPNFIESLDTYMQELNNKYDMLFVGDGCNLHIPSCDIIPGKHTYLRKYTYPKDGVKIRWTNEGATRCCVSYVVNKTCAKKMIDYIEKLTYKICEPVDWWLNTVIHDNKLDVYWAEPTIATQGSQNGLYSCSH
jgi:GR25 family glycosyltransferase involved in LPS biosynthesis